MGDALAPVVLAVAVVLLVGGLLYLAGLAAVPPCPVCEGSDVGEVEGADGPEFVCKTCRHRWPA